MECFTQISEAEPALAHAMLMDLARILALRLRMASDVISSRAGEARRPRPRGALRRAAARRPRAGAQRPARLARSAGGRAADRARQPVHVRVGPDGGLGRRELLRRVRLARRPARRGRADRLLRDGRGGRRRRAAAPAGAAGCAPHAGLGRRPGPARLAAARHGGVHELLGRAGGSRRLNGSLWTALPGLPRTPIRAWQIWNEPNLTRYWSSQPFAKPYVRLLRASRRALRAADPGSRTILARLPNESWIALRRIYQAGGRGAFDVVALHPTLAAADAVKLIEFARREMRRYRDAGRVADGALVAGGEGQDRRARRGS